MSELIPLGMEHLDWVLTVEAANQYSPWPRSEFEQSIHSARRRSWILCDNGGPVGYCVYSLVVDEAELLTISVDPRLKGRGYGRQLLEKSIALLHCLRIFLEVRASNTLAIGLYESTGFHEIAVRKGYYPTANGREDAIVYAMDKID